jgi:hypothetical protein
VCHRPARVAAWPGTSRSDRRARERQSGGSVPLRAKLAHIHDLSHVTVEVEAKAAYLMTDVHRLRFLQRSRSLGFSVEECRQLLSLYATRSAKAPK